MPMMVFDMDCFFLKRFQPKGYLFRKYYFLMFWLIHVFSWSRNV